MLHGYEVRGLSPATKTVIEVIVLAECPYEARRHAEECGLESVIVGEPLPLPESQLPALETSYD